MPDNAPDEPEHRPELMPAKRKKALIYFVLFMPILAGFFFLWPGTSYLQTDIFVSSDIRNLPKGLSLTGVSTNGIEVHIGGPGYIISTISEFKPKYILDLSAVTIGVNSIHVKAEQIPLPEGISIIRYYPTTITVKVDKEISRRIPVEIRLSGKPTSGFSVIESRPTPSSVLIRGPEMIMRTIENIYTERIDINGLSESLRKKSALDIPEGLKIDSSKIITANISIQDKIARKHFYNIRINGKNTPYQYLITPSSIDIQVKGPVNILDHLDIEKDIQVFVDLDELSPGVYVRPASIILPVDTTLVSVTPEIFTINMTNR
ncbi:MAG: CdaR family protein [Desulfobacterales bacterium]|nr:CdaR family protein [Desulfobacterales bacterium]MDD4073851.1 CdaR family protein [Desulfobacterales bacterium]MDD4392071.1 CdaR family protein [Desulfobacterales bacterium]